MKAMRLTLGALLMLCATTAFGQAALETPVEATRLTADNWEGLAPGGKESDGILGDLVLRNQYLIAVIAQPVPTRHANFTVQNVGGCLIDLTSRNQQSDLLECFYPGGKEISYRSWNLILDDEVSHEIGDEFTVHGKSIAVTVVSDPVAGQPRTEVTYRLGENDRYVTVTTRYFNTENEPLIVSFIDQVQADSRQERMLLTADGTAETYKIEDSFWRQAYAVRSPGALIQTQSQDQVSTLRYLAEDHQGIRELQPGESCELTRQIVCGPTGLHVRSYFSDEADAASYRQVSMTLQDGSRKGIHFGQVEVFQDGEFLGGGRANREGTLTLPLIEGEYTLRIKCHEIVAGEMRLHVGQPADQTPKVILNDFQRGTLSFKAVSEAGTQIPCKVQFIALGRTPAPDFGPVSAVYGVGNIRYSPDGRFIEHLVPGKYQIIISRGPEYDSIVKTIEIEPGQNTPVKETLIRSVNTQGWISTDFNSHTTRSGDNTSMPLGRVMNMACEQIEFAPCAEHNRVESYQRYIERLGFENFLSSVPGTELTSPPPTLNYQTIFPLEYAPRIQNGGGPAPSPDDVVQQLKTAVSWDDNSEKLIQLNHPDISELLKASDSEQSSHAKEILEQIDVIEVYPLEDALSLCETDASEMPESRFAQWLQLLNQGHRIPGVANTNSHSNFHGSASRRNWIRCSTDFPVEIDPHDIVRSAKSGKILMSNGPYLQVICTSSDEGATPVSIGEETNSTNGQVQLDVSVQCPNWHEIDTVFVLVNGRVQSEAVFHREAHPELFQQGTLKFHKTIPIELTESSHLIVVAGGRHSVLGPVVGPELGHNRPVAVSNPIYVKLGD